MCPPDCEVCGVCLMDKDGWKNCSQKHTNCCTNCESAYPHVIRLKERLSAEEEKVDNLRASLIKVIRSAEYRGDLEKYLLNNEAFNDLWNQLHYIKYKYDTYDRLLQENLVYGWLTIAAFDLFRSKAKGKTLEQKMETLHKAVIGIKEFEGWIDPKEKLDLTTDDIINQIQAKGL